MDKTRASLLFLGLLILVSGCLQPNLYAEAKLEEVNCTYSKINMKIDLMKPAEVTIFTGEGRTSLFVREHFEKSYLIENSRMSERVLITSGEEEYQTVMRLPQCACLLVDVRTEWMDPTLSFLITGIDDAAVRITANGQEKTVQVRKGEVKQLNFTMKLEASAKITGDVKATGVCEQEFQYSLDLKKVVVSGGTVTYSVGEYVSVEKKFSMEGVTDGFALNIGERSGNITVSTDGVPNGQASLQQNTLIIPGQFSNLSVGYVIVPTFTNERLLFSDQVVSQNPARPVEVTVNFQPGFAPYYYDPHELSVQKISPLAFTAQAINYTKLVNFAYGPEQVRLNLFFNATLTAASNTSARLEVLVPKNTNLQTVQSFQISETPSSTAEIDGETYHVFEWQNLKKGEVKSLQIQVQATRKAGLFSAVEEPLAPVGATASPYWGINNQMKQAANSLVGRNKYETIYNVVNHVKGRLNYKEDQARQGAINAYTSGSGACDEFSDTVIGMLRYLEIPAVYVSGYTAQPSGNSPPGSHAWVKILDSQEMEIDPQEMLGALDPYRVEFYTEYGPEKSRYWVYGNVTFREQLVRSSYTIV